MVTRPLIATAILLQAVLGNICMMPMAPSFVNDVPMAFANDADMLPHGCDGHCMADTLVTTTVVPLAFNAVPSIVSSSYVVTEQSPPYRVVLPAATSPPTAMHITTTVLRL